MLVLSRKVGERVLVGERIAITVTKVSGSRVTLAIDAPDEVRILRGELREFEIIPAAPPQQLAAPAAKTRAEA